jgi:spermidine export protein MdtJ
MAVKSGFYIMLILLIVIFESIGQYHIKKSKISNSLLFLLIGIFSYSIVCLLLKKCYDFNGMGITNFVWSVLSIVSVLMVGVLAFDEKITKIDIIGIILSISGLYLIFVFEHPN